jgi:hypothetical protein
MMTRDAALEILDAMVVHLDRKVDDYTRRSVSDRARKASHLVAVAVYRDEAVALRMAIDALKDMHNPVDK